MNRLRLAAWIVAVALAPAGIALASATLPTPTPKPTTPPSLQTASRLNVLKTHGAAEIDRRLDNLQKTSIKVAASRSLVKSDKDAITARLQTETNKLVSLKSQLSGETDLTAARTDVQAIIDDYKVYGLLYPEGWLIATADRLLTVGAKYETLRSDLQHKITAAQQQHKNATQLQAKLDDLRAKLADAKAHYQPLPAIVLNLPSDYTAAYKVLTTQRSNLATARTDLSVAQADGQAIIDGLGHLTAATPTPTASSPVVH